MLLEKIQSPKDVKVLSMPQLHELAQEIRDGILNRDSNIGVRPLLSFAIVIFLFLC